MFNSGKMAFTAKRQRHEAEYERLTKLAALGKSKGDGAPGDGGGPSDADTDDDGGTQSGTVRVVFILI